MPKCPPDVPNAPHAVMAPMLPIPLDGAHSGSPRNLTKPQEFCDFSLSFVPYGATDNGVTREKEERRKRKRKKL